MMGMAEVPRVGSITDRILKKLDQLVLSRAERESESESKGEEVGGESC